MRISWYLHAWQAFLMFFAGLACLCACLVGYILSGGAEEMLRYALVGQEAYFDTLDPNFSESALQVRGLKVKDLADQKGNTLSGIGPCNLEVKLDLWPKFKVEHIQVEDLKTLTLSVQEGTLQDQGYKYPEGPPIPINFNNVNVIAKIKNGPQLELEGCSGTLRQGPDKKLIGQISLKRLNGRDFPFTISSEGDGRWEISGSNLNIDTKAIQDPALGMTGNDKVDPLFILLRTLLSGESVAKGTLTALRVSVKPAIGDEPFDCEGQVAYKNLEFQLPKKDNATAGAAVPQMLDWMLGAKKSLWPRWLIAEKIRTGEKGRFSFHMTGHRLEFACDEGSQFIAAINGKDLPSLVSLKGMVVTDEQHRPLMISMRGYLGDGLNAEVSLVRDNDGSRVLALMVEPSARGNAGQLFGSPLWRASALVNDHSEIVDAAAPGNENKSLVDFDLEFSSARFWDAGKAPLNAPMAAALLLPPGVRDLSGRYRVMGQYLANRKLILRSTWKNGGLVYGGPDIALPEGVSPTAYGPFFDGMKSLWGNGSQPWELLDIDLQGETITTFDAQTQWLETKMIDWKLNSGRVVFRGYTTDLAAQQLSMEGFVQREPLVPGSTKIDCGVTAKDNDWSMNLEALWKTDGNAWVTFREQAVPLKLHPERESMADQFIRGGIFSDKRVYRETKASIENGKITREAKPIK